MKERLLLLSILVGLVVFLILFQHKFNTIIGLLILIGIMCVYCTYTSLATKHKKRKLRKNPQIVNPDFKPFVSVLIPAHNEDSVISATIENVLKMDYENFEVIVIDDRSSDNTAQVIRELENKYEKVTAMVRPLDAFPGKSAVLNDAMKIAKGEAILVFDADARVDADFLSKMIPHLEPEDVGACQARKVVSNKDVNFLTRCQNNEMTLDTHFQTGRDAIKGAVELRGNGELIKRKAIEDIGGWNNETIVDDLDMSTRLHLKGWDVRFISDTNVYEESIVYLVPLFKQRRRWLEGSIRRYLEYFGDVLTSREMSLRASLDMTAYITEFLMPTWFILEVVIRSIKFAAGKIPPNSIISSLLIGIVIGIAFTAAIRYAIRRYDHVSRTQALIQAIETSIYLLAIWFPVMVYILFKILLFKKSMAWGKTTHGLILEEEEHHKQNKQEDLAQRG